MGERHQRLVLAYQPEGFRQIGGLRRIAIEAVNHLRAQEPDLALATLCDHPTGTLPNTSICRTLRRGDSLLIVGCNSPWTYCLALWARLRSLPVSWMPCFHDPHSAIHRLRAQLAQQALKAMQALGVVIYVLTEHERHLVQGSKETQNCRLSGHGIPAKLRQKLSRELRQPPQPLTEYEERPIDLIFLGRPTAQKGWPVFIDIAQASRLRCKAIVPFPPLASGPVILHHQPSDAEVEALLSKTKLAVIPANYESFGIAQVEAVLAGCVVPILGHWPLWDGFGELQWQQLDRATLAMHCQELCNQPARLRQLHQHQLAYLYQHPLIQQPFLPGLL